MSRWNVIGWGNRFHFDRDKKLAPVTVRGSFGGRLSTRTGSWFLMIRDEIGKRLNRQTGAQGELADAVVFGIGVGGRFLVPLNSILGPGGLIRDKPARSQ